MNIIFPARVVAQHSGLEPSASPPTLIGNDACG
jgi:hypothetical protein